MAINGSICLPTKARVWRCLPWKHSPRADTNRACVSRQPTRCMQVADELFHNVVCGELQYTTRVLTLSSALQFLPDCDHIIVMGDEGIVDQVCSE